MIPSPSRSRAAVSGQKVEPIVRGSEIAMRPFHLEASRSFTLLSSPSFTWSTLTKTPGARTSVKAYVRFLSRSRKPASKPPRQLALFLASGATITGRIGSQTPAGFNTWSAVLIGIVATSQVNTEALRSWMTRGENSTGSRLLCSSLMSG